MPTTPLRPRCGAWCLALHKQCIESVLLRLCQQPRPTRHMLFHNSARGVLSVIRNPNNRLAAAGRTDPDCRSQRTARESDGRVGARRAWEPRTGRILGVALSTRNRTDGGGSGEMVVFRE